MFAVLGVARVGCFLGGCCWGVRSDRLGIVFPHYGSLYQRQLADGLIAPGSPTLPVVPAQALEAALLLGLCAWSLRALRGGQRGIFPHAVALYSAARFVLESVRDDPDRNFLGPLSTSQWIAGALLLAYGTWRLASSRTIVPAGASSSPR
jgi:phosphatidylglycerol:prolipoprotein diacylglycerol transferase